LAAEALGVASIFAAGTAVIGFVYHRQYKAMGARRTILVLAHLLSVVAIVTSYTWFAWISHRPGHAVLVATGLSIFALGGAAFLWSAFIHKTSLIPRDGAGLTVSGPYRFVRHPIYSAGLCSALGLLLASPHAGLAFDWLVLLACMILLIRSEEKELVARIPDYERYMQRTSSLIPFPR
jgi:protein-S-isoprenylcysteine O-methyltransferase